MTKRILLGVDPDLTPATQYAMRALSELIEPTAAVTSLMLLTVIPVPQVVTMHPGWYAGHVETVMPASWQYTQAQEGLRKARLLLQQQGYAVEHIECFTRVGVPADELVKMAMEYYVNLIVVGSRGSALKQRLRRLLLGSISRRVLRLASCPVMIAALPQPPRPQDLVAWYEKALRRYLDEHVQALLVFTPQQVALQFVPPNKKGTGAKESRAAELALEKLARAGLLYRRDIKGEVSYVND